MMKTTTLLLGLFLMILPKITIGQVISDFPCPDYPTVRDVYVPGTDNFHEYVHKSVICDLTEYPKCTIDFAFQVMISSKQFVAPYTEDVPVVNCGVSSIPKIGPIITVINNQQKTVQNYTLPGHVFHEGKILRYFEIKDNKLLIVTVGLGNNISKIHAWLNKNSLSQAIIWNPIDTKLSKKIIELLKQPEPPKLLNLAGTISKSAKTIPATNLLPFSEGLAVIHRGRDEAVINNIGDYFIPFGKYHYDEEGFKYGMCGVYEKYAFGVYLPKRGNKGFIDLSGKLAVPYKYIYAGFISPTLGFGREPLPNDDKPLHLINNKGQDLGIDLMKTTVPKMDNGNLSFGIKTEGRGESRRYTFIDYKGNEVISTQFLSAHNFSEGLAAVRKGVSYNNGKWGFINAKGQTVVPFIYTREPGDFHSGRAMVILKETKLKNGQLEVVYGYIDMSGKLIEKLTQKTSDCFSGTTMDWSWTEFNDYYVLAGKPDGCYSSNCLMDINGIKYDFSKINQTFLFHGREVTFSMTENSPEYFAIEGISHWKPLPRNWAGIPIIWRNQLTPINFKKGLLSPEGNLIIPPVFDELGVFDSVSKLAYAKYTDENGSVVEGYVNIDGVFQITKP